MKAEIINVGTELLLGDILNTNAQTISKMLKDLGISCYYQTVVGDNPERLETITRLALSRSDCIIFTGGLGPTYDDITRDIIAKALELSLVFDSNSLDRIENYFANRNRTMSDNNLKQAMFPEGSIIFENNVGTADGFAITKSDKLVIAVPGPPHEMNVMIEHEVFPYLKQFSNATLISDTLYLWGIGESDAESQVHDLMESLQNPTIAPYAGVDGVSIRITSLAKDKKTGHEMNTPYIRKLSDIFKPFVYSINIPTLEETLMKTLKEHKLSLSIFDNVTHGMIGNRLSEYDTSNEEAIFIQSDIPSDSNQSCQMTLTSTTTDINITVSYLNNSKKKTLPQEVSKVTKERRQRQVANEAMMMLIQLINLQ